MMSVTRNIRSFPRHLNIALLTYKYRCRPQERLAYDYQLWQSEDLLALSVRAVP